MAKENSADRRCGDVASSQPSPLLIQPWPKRAIAGVHRLARAMHSRAVRAVTSPRAAAAIGAAAYGIARRRPIPASDARAVLVVRLDQIGDVVLTTPLLRELRRALPNAWIGLVTNPVTRNLVELCPYVDEVIAYEYRAQGRHVHLIRHLRALQLARRHLWGRHIDLALLPRWDVDHYHGAFVAYFSGAARRVAYSESVTPWKQKANRGVDRLLTDAIYPQPPGGGVKHEVVRNLDTLAYLGLRIADDSLELWLDEQDRAVASSLLAQAEPPFVAIAPGAGGARRLWPAARFGAVANRISRAYDATVVILGAPGEEQLAEEMMAECSRPVINLVGKASLRQCAAVLENCGIFVGNDSGLMHIAAAMGVPVVEVSCHPFGGRQDHPNSPARFGPWGVPHRIVQPAGPEAPCDTACLASVPHCILRVSVDEVEAAAMDLLEDTFGERAGCLARRRAQ